MARTSFPVVPNNPPAKNYSFLTVVHSVRPIVEYLDRSFEWLRQLAEVANGSRRGKLNCVGDVTLTASSATTTLTDALIGPNSLIVFIPTTANAASAFQDGAFYVSARTKGSATITHTNDGNTDKTFVYGVIG